MLQQRERCPSVALAAALICASLPRAAALAAAGPAGAPRSEVLPAAALMLLGAGLMILGGILALALASASGMLQKRPADQAAGRAVLHLSPPPSPPQPPGGGGAGPSTSGSRGTDELAPPSPPPDGAGPSSGATSQKGLRLSEVGRAKGGAATKSERELIAAYDKDGNKTLDAEEVLDIVHDVRENEKKADDMEKSRDRYKKAFLLSLIIIALLFVSTFGSSLAGGLPCSQGHQVTNNNYLVASNNGEVLKVGSAEFAAKPLVSPSDESEEAATEWHSDPDATTTVLVDANGGAVATAAATDRNGVLVDAGGAAVKTEAAEYEVRFGGNELARFLLGATRKRLKGLRAVSVLLPDGMAAEFSIVGWSSRAFPVFGLHPTDDAGDSHWALGGSDAVAPVEPSLHLSLQTVLLEFQASSSPYRGIVAFSLSDPNDAEAEPWLALELVAQADLGRVGALIAPRPDDGEGVDASAASINHVMTKMVLEGHPLLELAHNNSLVGGLLSSVPTGRRLFQFWKGSTWVSGWKDFEDVFTEGWNDFTKELVDGWEDFTNKVEDGAKAFEDGVEAAGSWLEGLACSAIDAAGEALPTS